MARFGRVRVFPGVGKGFAIEIGKKEISKWRSGIGSWGSDLRSVRAWYDSGGDLVDLMCNNQSGCEKWDGHEMVSLTNDLQCEGEKRLKITDGRCVKQGASFAGARRKKGGRCRKVKRGRASFTVCT